MKNNLALVAVLLVIGFVGVASYHYASKQEPAPGIAQAVSYKNATYTIDGQRVTLTDGVAEVESAPGSASKTTTTYFGNEAKGDLNGDGIPDLAFLLTQSTGGSGTFFYVVGAIQGADGGYVGTDAVLLGDRIAPQTTEIKDGKLTVNYADRQRGESFTVAPSVGKSIVLKLDVASMQFGEVVQNFEGEADPNTMKLNMKAWNWVNTLDGGGAIMSVPKTPKFTLTFKDDNTFSATTDCNSIGGEYVTKGNAIAFSKMVSTLMFCEGSQEAEFSSTLSEVTRYEFTSKGELVFATKHLFMSFK